MAWFLAYGYWPGPFLLSDCENDACVNVHHAFESRGTQRMIAARRKDSKHSQQGSTAAKQARDRDGNCCRVCGFADALNVHHIVHRARGGSDDLENLITLCPNHHAMAHLGKLREDMMRELIGAPPRLPLPSKMGQRQRQSGQRSENSNETTAQIVLGDIFR